MAGYIRKEAVRAGALREIARRTTTRWTVESRKRFLDELGATSNVSAAARAAGMSDSSAYRLRHKDAAFRAAWAAALAEGYARLEMMLLERALNGTSKPVWHGGREVGAITQYSDQTALSLLAEHRGAVKGETGPPAVETRKQIAERLTDKLMTMGARMRAAEARGDLAPMDGAGGGETAHELITSRKAGTRVRGSRTALCGADAGEASRPRRARS